MAEQTWQKAGKSPTHARENDLVSHVAVRPWTGYEQQPAREAAPASGRDLSQATVRAAAPLVGRDYGASTCPLAPTRCPYGGACHTCPMRIQTNLAIDEPGDIYEQEADRVAGQIMHASTSQVQRHAGSRATSAVVPPIVHEVLSSPGQPLDAATRAFMEPRFGQSFSCVSAQTCRPLSTLARLAIGAQRDASEQEAETVARQVMGRPSISAGAGCDFSGVRIHTDDKAAASARAVNAVAYAMGQDVVFGKGQYAPETTLGKHLLAHELAHVVQQRNSMAPAVRRQPGPTTVEVNAPPHVCSLEQTRQLVPSVAMAQRWLQDAGARLTAYLGAIGTPAQRTGPVQGTGLSLLRHFNASDADTARYVQNKIRLIADRLRTDPGGPSPLTVECHAGADTSCGSAAAYVQGSLLVFCPSFFSGGDAAWNVMAVIHEIAHSLPPATGPLQITDRAYRGDRLYGSLSAGEALTNAESYAILVRELATGRIGGNAPRDTNEDCPREWRGELSEAIAMAQRWNRDAQGVVHDSRPGFLAQWQGLAATHLGGQSPTQIAAAQAVYDQAETRLHEKVDFECETEGGGRCDTSLTYWYALGDFHICPSWHALRGDEDRAQALLAGLYGYFRIVDDHDRRRHMAQLARDLHFQWWAPPSATDVSGALTGTRTQPQPAAAPPPGPRPM